LGTGALYLSGERAPSKGNWHIEYAFSMADPKVMERTVKKLEK